MQKPTAKQREYWDAKLKEFNLGMERGVPKWLSFGFDVKDLDFDGRRAYRTDQTTNGERLDEDEWPLSLY